MTNLTKSIKTWTNPTSRRNEAGIDIIGWAFCISVNGIVVEGTHMFNTEEEAIECCNRLVELIK
jgi:hypothetical protein